MKSGKEKSRREQLARLDTLNVLLKMYDFELFCYFDYGKPRNHHINCWRPYPYRVDVEMNGQTILMFANLAALEEHVHALLAERAEDE